MNDERVDYAALYADAEQMKDHWWWRPGWRVGTRFYAWHLTLDGQDDLHRLVDDVQHSLRDVPTLDPVPRQWRHITMTGMGHVGDVPDDLRDRAVDNVRRALAGFGSIDATFEHVSIFPEAVALRPNDPQPFTTLQNLAQRATAEVIPGADPHNPGFRAHVSTHYSSGTANVRSVRQAVSACATRTGLATFDTLDLIRMHRDHRMYEWEVVASLPLGG